MKEKTDDQLYVIIELVKNKENQQEIPILVLKW